MSKRDRQAIGSLSSAANGQGRSPVDKKKRQREDERPSTSARRLNPFASTLSNDTLRNPTRSSSKGAGSTLSYGNLPNFPRVLQKGKGLAQAAFPHPSSNTREHSSEETITSDSSFRNGELIMFSGQPTTSNGDYIDPDQNHWTAIVDERHSHAAESSHPQLSAEFEQIMSGSGSVSASAEEEISIGVWFDNPMPQDMSVKPDVRHVETLEKQRDRSSSADPLDLILEPEPSPVHHVAKQLPVEHITIDDDDEEEVVQMLSDPSRARTPTGKTPFKEGHVKKRVQEVAAKQDHLSQQTLRPFLEQTSNNAVASASRISQPRVQPRPATKGQSITPGFTRPPIVRNMKTKGGLKIQSTGAQAKEILPASSQSRKDTTHPPPKSVVTRREDFGFDIDEWYCANRRHGNVKLGQTEYKLYCGPGNMVSFRTPKYTGGEAFVLAEDEIAELQVAETGNANTDVEELVPALRLHVTEKCLGSVSWERFSDKDPYPWIMVVLNPLDGVDKWRHLMSCLGSIKKNTIPIATMSGLVQQARAQLAKKPPQSKLIAAEPQEDRGTLLATVPPTMMGPSTRTRNRTATYQPKDEPNSAPKVQLPPQDPDEIMLVYPSAGPGAVNINRAELLRLENGEFLNDTLIELGLKLWLNRLRDSNPELVDQIHIFNSFFFKKLDGGRGPCDYNSVKKWTSKIDLFKKKFIIVPINEHLHWYLAIIYLPEHALDAPPPQPARQPTRKTRSSNASATKADEPRGSPESDTPHIEPSSIIDVEVGSPMEPGCMEIDTDLANRSQQSMVLQDVEMADPVIDTDTKLVERPATPVLDMTNDDFEVESQTNTNARKCWILVCDSLRGKHTRTIRILREYLQAEAREKYGKLIETKDAKLSGGFIEDKHLPVPEQPNWCDCGVYLLHYVEAFVANPLELLVLPGIRRKSPPDEAARYNELWRKEDVEKKRETFRDHVHGLSRVWRQAKSQPAQVSQDIPTPAGELPSNPHPHSLLPDLGGEPSLIETGPPQARTIAKESIAPSMPEPPIRTGELPPSPHPSPPPNPLLFPQAGQLEDMGVVETSSPGNETRSSEGQYSMSGHKVRRGKKGGDRHNNPDWSMRSAQISQTLQALEVTSSQPSEVSEVIEVLESQPPSPDL